MPKTKANNLRLVSKSTAILVQEKYSSLRSRLLQATAVRGYHAFNKKPFYYMVVSGYYVLKAFYC